MARTATAIKAEMTAVFMNNSTAASMWGFTVGDNFDATFSKVSVESILFYVFAYCANTVEQIFDTFKAYVTALIDAKTPHTAKWYRDKMLLFMKDKLLVTDTDTYDTGSMTDSEIEAAKVIKYAAAVENSDSSILTIKVAGELAGERVPFDSGLEAQITEYIQEVKDAGVRVGLVNQAGDSFSCEVDVYYNALLLPGDVQTAVNEAIVNYIENLTFNGEYSNMALVDAIQVVDGVEIVEFKWAKSADVSSSVMELINAKKVPVAGYFKSKDITINMVAHAVL
jgi:hypothetical protein